MAEAKKGREFNEKNVSYESSIVLPGSKVSRFTEAQATVKFKGVDVQVFKEEQDAEDWMHDRLFTLLRNDRKKLIKACKAIGGQDFRYSRYVDWEGLMKHVVDNYGDSSVVPDSFRKRFRSDEEGKKAVYDDVVGFVNSTAGSDYRTSQVVFDYVDFGPLLDDLLGHLGMRVFKQGSFYYAIDNFNQIFSRI